jgi:hypothetical protein
MNSGAPFGTGFLPVLRSTLIRWERLRIPYNLILIAIVIVPVGGGPVELPELADLPILAVGAVLANLCYLAGPAAESYLAWLGLKSRWVTLALFAGGVLISFPLVYMFGIAYVLSSS